MCTWLPILSVDLWEADDAKDNERKINAALRAALKPKEMVQSNDDVEREMDKVDEGANSVKLMDMIRNEATKIVKSQMRKNYSGDAKSQVSRPTKNGRGSNVNSNAGKQGKGKTQKQTEANSNANKDKQGKPTKKGKGGTANDPKSAQQSTKKGRQGSQGGSSNGGKRKGAGRR